MSELTDTIRAAGTTAAVVAGAAMGHGPSNADTLASCRIAPPTERTTVTRALRQAT